MSGHGGNAGTVDFVRKAALLVLLTVAMLGIHQFALPPEGFEVRGLFALGYIILAAYTVGELAEVIKLPHITGYLLAGLVLGPSVAHIVEPLALPPPLDHGILNQNVVDQLVLLDSLALALIALTAGGELKLEELRDGIKQIAGVLAGQAVTIAVGVVLFLVAALSVAPDLLPPVSAAGTTAIVALGGVVASISFATSPAATIAVINSTGARGPLAKTVLSAVVLKDVLVVIAFSATMAIATGVLGASTEGGFLLSLWHITQSILLGVAIGGLLHLYLRFVGAELLLFLVGVIYTTTFVAEQIHAEAALVFIVAGIVVSNFSDRGETLIHEVERLSMPVYVVFFTLAGAKLHLDELWAMLPLALGLVGVRILALVAGVRAGAQLTGADASLTKYGWMGFVSQAGLAITLATQLKDAVPGGIGEAMFSVLLGGVAINEMLGPVLLQTGLGLAGEVHEPTEAPERDDPTAQAPLPNAPPDLDLSDPFGEPLATGVEPLDRAVSALQSDLQLLVRDRTWAPMMEMRRDADTWLRQLRRDLLRIQRGLVNHVDAIQDDGELATAIRHGVGSLGERWRTHVLSLAARIPRSDRWSPLDVVEGVDAHVNSLQPTLTAPILPISLAARPENVVRRGQRQLLALRHRLGAEREVNLRDLARYHLSGEVPSRLEGVAALMVDGEMQMAAQVQALFEELADRWEEAAHAVETGATRDEVRALLNASRVEGDDTLDVLSDQLDAVAREGVARSAAIVGWGVRRLKEDVERIGTFDLPHRRRRFSRVFAQRNHGLAALGPLLVEARRVVSARYAQLALELELVGLEGRIQDAVQVHGTQLARLVRGRGPKQLELVETGLQDWLTATSKLLDDVETAGPLGKSLRAETEPLIRRIQEARKAVEQLRQDLSDESWLGPLLDQLHVQAQGLTAYYTVPSTRPTRGSWTLPPPVSTTDIAFQELATQVIETGVTRDLLDLTGDIASKVQELASVLDEVERVVTFNVDLAMAELDVVDEDAPLAKETRELVRAMLSGAVGRSHTRLKKLVLSATEHAEGVRNAVQGAVIGRFDRLHQQILDGHLAQLRLDALRDAALGGGVLARAGQWSGMLPEGRQRLAQVLERTLGHDRIAYLSDALGLPNDNDGAALRDVLAAPEPTEAVPVVYRRLFADHALEGTDLLSGRTDALATVRRVLHEDDRRLRSVAVISVDNQASRALVNTALRTFQGTVVRLEADRPWTREDVDRWLEGLPHKDACLVVEGLRWLYRRQPGGTEPIERLVRAMVADGGRRAWVLHADPAVWSFLTGSTAIGEGTGERVQLGPLSADDLEDAVLARHAMSGYTASFGDDDDLPLLTRVLGRRDRERRRQREWFQALHDASAGVLQDALRLWMAAIDRVDEEEGALHLGMVPRPPVAQLAELPDDVLLTLVQVLRQGWMDADQHAWLFRVDVPRADAHLAQLVHLGLLEEQGPRVLVRPHLRGPLERALRLRGWA